MAWPGSYRYFHFTCLKCGKEWTSHRDYEECPLCGSIDLFKRS